MNTTYHPRNHFDSTVAKIDRFRRRTEQRCAWLAGIMKRDKAKAERARQERPEKGTR